MNKNNLTRAAKEVMKRHGSDILTGFGIAGMIATTILAVRATPKALNLIEKKKEEQEEPLTRIEIIKTTWHCYISAAVTGVVSTACLIGANTANARRSAALAAAYTLSESAFKGYREKVIETIGEKKERTVRDAVAKETIERNPLGGREVIITEKGNTLCYDAISGRYFNSDIDSIKKALNEINRRLLSDMFVSLNDFYYEIGLRETKLGDVLGWMVDGGLINLSFSSQLASDGTPCLVMDYQVAPRYAYTN